MLSSLCHQQESKKEAPAGRKRPTRGHRHRPVRPQGSEPEPRTRQTQSLNWASLNLDSSSQSSRGWRLQDPGRDSVHHKEHRGGKLTSIWETAHSLSARVPCSQALLTRQLSAVDQQRPGH